MLGESYADSDHSIISLTVIHALRVTSELTRHLADMLRLFYNDMFVTDSTYGRNSSAFSAQTEPMHGRRTW